MGIRFLCPNGHKLNVKGDLAGKRGVCPDCGAKFVIPSAVPGSAPSQTTPPNLGITPPELPSSFVLRRPTPALAPALPATNGASQPPPAAIRPSLAPPQTGAWYVRPPTGGQFGPATDEVFHTWIAEGRVTTDAHVWHEGWPEWRLVRDAVAALPGPPEDVPIDVAPAPGPARMTGPPKFLAQTGIELTPTGPIVAEEANLTASPLLARRQRIKRIQITLAIIMLLAVFVLAGVLIWVMRRDTGQDVTAAQAFQPDKLSPDRVAQAFGPDSFSSGWKAQPTEL